MPTTYTARWVVPITSPPIEDGAITIEGSTIIAAGARAQLQKDFSAASVKDFGDAAIIPGLVNVHSHLELTVMRGFLEKEESDFFAWLRKLTIARLAMTDDDLLASAALGSIEAARAGVTCLGDSSSFATQSMRALNEIGLRGIVYQESFGPDPKLAEENVAKLRAQLSAMRDLENDLVRTGVSPHAPYTVSARQLEMISRLAIKDNLPLMMHAAESRAEQAFMIEGRGPFADGLKSRGIDWQAPGLSTIRYLSEHGVLDTRPLLAHCINVDSADLELIKTAGAGIGHCPKSNAKLGHGRAPFGEFIQHEINTGLGSDSVASNNTCDILEEARFATLMARGSTDFSLCHTDGSQTEVCATQALFAATLGGARAMGLGNQIGALQPGMEADIAVVSLGGAHQQPVSDPVDTLVFSCSGRDVIATMVAGREIFRDQAIVNANESEFRNLADGIRAKIGAL